MVQLTSQTELYDTGFRSYLHSTPLYCGFIAGYFGLLLVSGEIRTRTLNLPQHLRLWLLSAGTAIAFVFPAVCLVLGVRTYEKCSFALFGMVIGALVFFICHRDSILQTIKVGLLVLAVMWTVSISIGYNFPVLGAGLAALLLAGFLRDLLPSDSAGNRFRRAWRWCLFGSAAITLVCFGISRSEYIYRDRPASELRYSLDGILPGGKHIRTNLATFEYMKDIHDIVKGLGGREYAIIPEAAIYWVKAPQRNPLPSDWPQDIELGTPGLFERVVHALEIRRGRLVILASKVGCAGLSSTQEPITEKTDMFRIVLYVRSHFHKIGETKYFDIYD